MNRRAFLGFLGASPVIASSAVVGAASPAAFVGIDGAAVSPAPAVRGFPVQILGCSFEDCTSVVVHLPAGTFSVRAGDDGWLRFSRGRPDDGVHQ